MESTTPQYYCVTPKVHHANILHHSNNYFVSTVNSYVDVASVDDNRYVASADTFDNAPHHIHHNYRYYGQEPMPIMNSLSFNATSNI